MKGLHVIGKSGPDVPKCPGLLVRFMVGGKPCSDPLVRLSETGYTVSHDFWDQGLYAIIARECDDPPGYQVIGISGPKVVHVNGRLIRRARDGIASCPITTTAVREMNAAYGGKDLVCLIDDAWDKGEYDILVKK